MKPFPFVPAGFFAFRTPTLPYDFLEPWSGTPAGTLLEAQRQHLRDRLREAVGRPEIREALFLASPDLEERLEPWLQGGLDPDKRGRIERSLVRYLSRMASRPTPFGLFAGCSLGTWGEATCLATLEGARSSRHTRLDMAYLCALADKLEGDPAVRQALRYRPNSSLYAAAGRWRYAEGRLQPDLSRTYSLVALEDSPHLAATLQRAGAGASIEALAAPLAGGGIALEMATAFIHELIDHQVLVADLHPAVTGPEPIHGMVERLRGDPKTQPMAAALAAVRDALQALDEGGVGQAPARYRIMAKDLERLPAKVKLQQLFQVDLVKPAPGACLDGKVQAALLEAVALSWRLTVADAQGPLQAFRTGFVARYGDRWMPLLEALDLEAGLGFGGGNPVTAQSGPLLEGLRFPAAGGGVKEALSPRYAFILNRLQELGPGTEWALGDADLEALENPEPAGIPDAFCAMASLVAASPEAVDAGHFKVVLEGYSGPSGARLLGRFCHGDPDLALRVKAHLQREEELQPEVVFAEIVHHPEGRIGNILCRPLLRQYEIPYLGVSGAPEACQIPLQDLWVAVQGERVVLRSRKLGRQVVPRLTSAHNYTQGLGVYRFLGLLQDQGGSYGGWSWGPLDSLAFLPRVVRGRHVLQKCRWRVRQEELRPLLVGSPDQVFEAFRELRTRRGLPRWVLLLEGDHELLVDLDQPLWLETLLHLVAKRPSFVLQEVLPGDQDLVARGPEGRYCHQLVVPFLRKDAVPAAIPQLEAEAQAPRVFLPGSEWLYLKIYTGVSTADQVLLQALAPLLDNPVGLFDRWFFLRYSDPDPHLRLRFHGEPERLVAALLPRLHTLLAPLQARGWLWKLQTDTYEREVERYGGASGILLAEELFSHDSRAVVRLLKAYAGDEGAPWRWRLGLKAVDALLDDLGLDLAGKTGFARDARAGFKREFQAGRDLDVQLGQKFRAERRELEAVVFEGKAEPAARLGLEILEDRSRAWSACLKAIRSAEAEGTLLRSRTDLAASYAHMHLNRLLPAAQRAQEFVIYDFLLRLYQSRLAREERRGA